MITDIPQSWPAPTSPKPIVIIGAGGIVRDAHMPAYAKAGLTVSGVTDLDEGAVDGHRHSVVIDPVDFILVVEHVVEASEGVCMAHHQGHTRKF